MKNLGRRLGQPEWVTDHLLAWLKGPFRGWQRREKPGLVSAVAALNRFVRGKGLPHEPDGMPRLITFLVVPARSASDLPQELEDSLQAVVTASSAVREGMVEEENWLRFARQWVAAAKDGTGVHYFSLGPVHLRADTISEFLLFRVDEILRERTPEAEPEPFHLSVVVAPWEGDQSSPRRSKPRRS